MLIVVILMPPASGSPPTIIDAWTTPGTWPIRSTRSASSSARFRGASRDSILGETCAVNTFVASNPVSIFITETKLPMKSAAPTRSTTASATSTTTSALRSRRRPDPAVPRAPSFNAVDRSGLDSCSAGTIPNSRPVTIAAAAAAVSTRRLTAIRETRGRLSGSESLRR